MKKARALVALVAALLLCSVVTLAASGALEGETAGEPAAVLPEYDSTLTERPAWVVTFHNVGIMLHGPAKGEPVQADVYVIVDAETGAWLETVSAPAQT